MMFDIAAVAEAVERVRRLDVMPLYIARLGAE